MWQHGFYVTMGVCYGSSRYNDVFSSSPSPCPQNTAKTAVSVFPLFSEGLNLACPGTLLGKSDHFVGCHLSLLLFFPPFNFSLQCVNILLFLWLFFLCSGDVQLQCDLGFFIVVKLRYNLAILVEPLRTSLEEKEVLGKWRHK